MNEAGLGNRLKDLRERHQLTQAGLAAAIGVSRKTINTIENQVFVPSTVLALKIAAALKVKVEDVFFLD